MENIKLVFRLVAFLAIILSFTSINQINAQAPIIPGEIPVKYDVSPSGAFGYSVPIRIPEGINGLVPELSINYNSQAGNGMLGYGWSLSGLSSITRGMPTIFHDQLIEPADLNTDDVFFLDGQRLFSIGGGKYITEVKNFADIQTSGTTGTGPTSFQVEYPNGIIYQYGVTTNSRMIAQGSSEVLMWYVNKIQDQHGNYISFSYHNSPTTGEYRISQITYGQSNAVTISFNYVGRQDENLSYINGSKVASNKLLKDITVTYPNSGQANKYEFTYDYNQHSRLIKIEEQRDGSEVLSPILINYPANSSATSITSTQISSSSTSLSSGDYNGDGFSDLVAFTASGSNTQMEIYLNDYNGSGNFTAATPINVSFVNAMGKVINSPNRLVFDYTGDGLDDVIVVEEGVLSGSSIPYFKLWLLKANGQSSVFDAPSPIYYGYNNNSKNTYFNALKHFIAGDFDGDGKSEVIVVQPYNFHTLTSVTDYEFFLVGDEYSTYLNPWQIDHFSHGHIDAGWTVDYNGDGKDEYLIMHKLNGNLHSFTYELKLSYDALTLKPALVQSGTQWPYNLLCTSTFPHTLLMNWPADFNGDGKTDLISWETNSVPNNWLIAYSNGVYNTYTSLPPINVPAPLSSNLDITGPSNIGSGDYSYYAIDFNGDGLSDFLQLNKTAPGQSDYDIFYSQGMSFIHETGSVSFDADESKITVGDFNGDGQVDLMSSYGFKYLSFKPQNNSLIVSSIEHAGKTISVEYDNLTTDDDYITITTTAAHHLTRTIPIKVAKHIYDGFTIDNRYIYQGCTFHTKGLGLKGFKEFIVENNVGQKIYQTFNVTKHIPYMESTQIFDAWGGMPYASHTTYNQIDENGGAGGKSRIIIPYAEKIIDSLNAQITEKTITTGSVSSGTVFYDYGQIEAEETRTTDLAGVNNSLQTTTYDYGANWATNKGKPERVEIYSDIDPNGSNSLTGITEYTYYSNGEVETVTKMPGTQAENVTTYIYDAFGNIHRTELVATGVSGTMYNEYTYSTDGKFKIQEENTMGYITTYDYGTLSAAWGNVLGQTSYKGVQTTFEYDVLNRVVKSTDVATGIETYTGYEWASSSAHSTGLPDEHISVTTSNSYDQSFSTTISDIYGRVLRKVKPTLAASLYEDFTYNAIGKLESASEPYRTSNPGIIVYTHYQYDNYNRETQHYTTSGGPTINTTYAINNGLLHTTVTTQATNQDKTSVTCGKTLRKVYKNVANGPDEIEYTYYGNGTTSTTTVNNKIFTNVVDQFGRTISRQEPNAGTNNYEYDALDRVTKETLATGIEYEYRYDLLGRVREKEEVGPGLPPYEYIYENTTGLGATGELAEQIAPNGFSYEYIYDGHGRVISLKEITDITLQTVYAYHPNGQLSYYFFPRDITIEYLYSSSGILNEVNLLNASGTMPSPKKLWLKWDIDEYGQLKGAYHFDVNDNPLYHVARSYDVHGLPDRRKVENILPGMGSVIADELLQFSVHTGNLASRTNNILNHTEVFSYDDVDRLTDIDQSIFGGPLTQILSMQYDRHGNIEKKPDVAPVLPDLWKYSDYALTTIPVPPPPSPSIKIPLFDQEAEYTSFQKVKRLREDQNTEMFFTYGPDEQRVKAEYFDITGGPGFLAQTKFYGSNYESIVTPFDTTEYMYVWGEDELVAILELTTPNGTSTTTGKVYYPVTDHLGSITHLLDNTGIGGMMGNGVLEERSFDAWGRPRDPVNWMVYDASSGNPHPGNWLIDRGYTGHEHIWCNTGGGFYDNNVINMNGRLYDPLIGRMFSPDPLIGDEYNSQSYNKYSYVMNNPLKYTDPTGNLFVGATSTVVLELGRTIFERGGLEFWHRNNFNNAWARFDPGNEGTISNNAWKIDHGMFAWTDNKTVAGNLVSILSRFTWESQQVEWGKTFAHMRNNFGQVQNVEYYEGATIVNRVNEEDNIAWGSTVGNYIHTQNIGDVDGYTNQLLRHEYGHSIQSRIYGPLYLSQVGVPSVIGSILNGSDGRFHDHDTEWYETQANRLSNRYHRSGMRGQGAQYLTRGLPWDDFDNPRDYRPNAFWIFFHPINPFWLINVN